MENEDRRIKLIKDWLGTGSINIFGLPLSGKDTVGVRLAEALDGRFLSSGMILRSTEAEERENYADTGLLTPTDIFYDRVLPYLDREDLKEYPLVLSSVGRWYGEEDRVMDACEKAGHPIKAVISLNVSESDVLNRWHVSKETGDRGDRADDRKEETFQIRIQEFRNKTLPVLQHYHKLGLLVSVNADQSRDDVFDEVLDALASKAA